MKLRKSAPTGDRQASHVFSRRLFFDVPRHGAADMLACRMNTPEFVSRRSPKTLGEMLQWLEDYRRWFPLTKAQREARRDRKCDVEFVL